MLEKRRSQFLNPQNQNLPGKIEITNLITYFLFLSLPVETSQKADKKTSKSSKLSTAITVEAPKDQENTVTVTVAKKENEKEKEKAVQETKKHSETKDKALDEAKEWYWDYDNECWKECDPNEEYEWEYIESDEENKDAKEEENKASVTLPTKVPLHPFLHGLSRRRVCKTYLRLARGVRKAKRIRDLRLSQVSIKLPYRIKILFCAQAQMGRGKGVLRSSLTSLR